MDILNQLNIILGTPQITSGLTEMEWLIIVGSIVAMGALYFITKWIIKKMRERRETGEQETGNQEAGKQEAGEQEN